MGALKLELETEVVWCYCCEDFTPHEVYDGQEDNVFYQCDCGCVLDDSEDEVIRKP